jgi:hypothetical protein
VINSIIAGNTAGADGGGTHVTSSSLESCNVAGNTATGAGGGVYNQGDVTNTIMWDNSPEDLAGDAATYSLAGDDPIFSGYPLPSSVSVWSSVVWDEVSFTTTLTVDGTPWEPGALAGRFVRPDDAINAWYTIASNTQDQIQVFGNAATDVEGNILAEAGDVFSLFDLHLGIDSPCIDAGDGSTAERQDFDGIFRSDIPERPNLGLGPPWADIGAFEYGDGSDPICGAPRYTDDITGHFYVCSEASTWADAIAYCPTLGWGAHIVRITSEEENDFIAGIIDQPSWIGANDIESDTVWRWESNGSSLASFDNWMESHPYINDDYDCAVMESAGEWRDIACSELNAFVCEF